MGADVVVRKITNRRWGRQLIRPSIDIREVEGKETFILDVPEDLSDRVSVSVIDNQPKLRHLLLQIRTEGEIAGRAEVEKYLCGHDERHWFVSAVQAKNVKDAFDALKPKDVHAHEKRIGVKRARKNKHHNEAFTRQGEWFFVPAPDFNPGKNAIIHKNEPISRGRGSKPHMCEELIRFGGERVYVSSSRPNGITESEFNKMRREAVARGERQTENWQLRVADATVYVRGKVRHPDHKTVDLKVWHRVQINGEIVSANVRFLD